MKSEMHIEDWCCPWFESTSAWSPGEYVLFLSLSNPKE
jgi:hypothetical protein